MSEPTNLEEEVGPIPQPETAPDEPPKVEPKKEEKKPVEVSAISLDSKGKVVAKNNSELMRYLGAMTLSGAVPERFDTPQKLFGAVMLVRDLGLPDTAIRQVAVIHGTPSIFGDLPLALVQKSGEVDYFKENWFDKDYNVICFENKNLHAEAWGAVCFLRRRDHDDIQSFSFTLDEARQAGLYPDPKPSKPWNKYTRMMLRYRARSIALKSLFADKINGIAIAEYDFDETSETVKDVTPKENTANKLNDLNFDNEARN